jgi:hypothetical protein
MIVVRMVEGIIKMAQEYREAFVAGSRRRSTLC